MVFKLWSRILQNGVALGWKEEDGKAEKEVHSLIEAKDFAKDGHLTADDFDNMFRLMKRFSANRALSNLLYRNNGLDELASPSLLLDSVCSLIPYSTPDTLFCFLHSAFSMYRRILDQFFSF